MAVLVDEPIWDWRGRKWAHLVSDSNLDELHDFAHRIGMPYLAFQGDHYDIHSALRVEAIAAGAVAVTGREIVGALHRAGLRVRGGLGPWRWAWEHSGDADRWSTLVVDHPATADLDRLVESGAPVTVARAERAGESVIVASTPAVAHIEVGLRILDATNSLHRSIGERGTYVEWRRSASMPTRSRSSM